MAYATVADLQAGWRTLTAPEQSRATTLLDRAASILDAQVTVVTTDTAQAALLCTVSCSMVQRAMTSTDLFGVSQQSETAGSYSQSMTFANPSGDLYLTKQERKLLGIGAVYATGSIKVDIHDSAGESVDW